MMSTLCNGLIRAIVGPIVALTVGIAVAAASDLPSNRYDTTVEYKQAVFGDTMPGIVKNYLRATPYIGTGGVIDPVGIGELATLGFKAVISLNTTQEGVEAESTLISKVGVAFVNIPVSTKAPTEEQVAKFAKLAEDPSNYPILIHCQSANRGGAMWALYCASTGVPPNIAIEEGRTVGLEPNREAAVHERLGLPPL